MLALLHCSKQYNISGGRLGLLVNEAVYDIRQHVRGQMVEDLVGDDGRYEESREAMEQVVDIVAESTCGLEYAFKLLDYGVLGKFGETEGKTRDSIDTGELDGEKVQESWSLFKTALEYRTTTGDLLPPPGFARFGGQSQDAMKGIWR
ncbi:hypothetical protein B0T20DRAFT_404440 [Sordaria brevicollis]|uniref:Uncharacterized protein n=1 Tax=Sordaria brevicollis TaxID=83679 RepID=A0AAE0PIH6_SORBR|nr:hypothetical protein B0T20DRAFT_404440 [Sordaria brevicollis]